LYLRRRRDAAPRTDHSHTWSGAPPAPLGNSCAGTSQSREMKVQIDFSDPKLQWDIAPHRPPGGQRRNTLSPTFLLFARSPRSAVGLTCLSSSIKASSKFRRDTRSTFESFCRSLVSRRHFHSLKPQSLIRVLLAFTASSTPKTLFNSHIRTINYPRIDIANTTSKCRPSTSSRSLAPSSWPPTPTTAA